MTRDHASLQRKPFLTPIWLTVLGTFAAVIFCAFAVWVLATADSTTVVVAGDEPVGAPAGAPQPALAGEAQSTPGMSSGESPSASGDGRSGATLSRLFGGISGAGRIDAIYVSPTSRDFAAPLAAQLGLTPIVASTEDARGVARRAVREHSGGRVLVVWHGDTVTEIVGALSSAGPLPAQAGGGRTLYIVSVPRIGHANLLQLAY